MDFPIPLRDWTSCGYVFSPRISNDTEVAADLTAFLHEQGVDTWEVRGAPSFPNFLRRRMFDGRVFWVGNAASFIEPLEATTIGHAIVQIRSATRWILDDRRGRRADSNEIEAFNRAMYHTYVAIRSSSRGTMLAALAGTPPSGDTRAKGSSAPAATTWRVLICRDGRVCGSRTHIARAHTLNI